MMLKEFAQSRPSATVAPERASDEKSDTQITRKSTALYCSSHFEMAELDPSVYGEWVFLFGTWFRAVSLDGFLFLRLHSMKLFEAGEADPGLERRVAAVRVCGIERGLWSDFDIEPGCVPPAWYHWASGRPDWVHQYDEWTGFVDPDPETVPSRFSKGQIGEPDSSD